MSWVDALAAVSNDSQHRDEEDPFVCLLLSCKCLKEPRAAHTAIWQQSAPSSVSQRLLQQSWVFTWSLCSPWYPLDDRCGSRAASVDFPPLAMEKRGVKILYTLFQAFSHDMLKWIPGIIQMFQVTPREHHLGLMLTPVQREMSGKHLGSSRSSFVIWSLINTRDFCPVLVEISNDHKWTCRIPPLKVRLEHCNHSCLDFPVCIARKLFLVRLGLHWDLACQS